jgi:hypothetical protein
LPYASFLSRAIKSMITAKVLGKDGSAECAELRRRMTLVVVVWERGCIGLSYLAERRLATGVLPGRLVDVSNPFILVSVKTLLGRVFSPSLPSFSYAHHKVGFISRARW